MAEALQLHIKHLAESLHASQEEVENGKQQMKHIIDLLREAKNVNIKKYEVVCETAKEISIVGSIDFECFVFIDSSISEAMECFEEVLIDNTYMQSDEINKTPIQEPTALKFSYRGINFNIMVISVTPAMAAEYNLNEDADNTQEACISERQASVILSSYKDGSNKLTQNELQEKTPGLCVLTRRFMKAQSVFVGDIARLGKYWNNTLILDKEMEGDCFMNVRLAIIELIGVAAGCEQETHLKAFRNFLQKIRDIRSMKLSFSSNQSFYKITDIPHELRTAPPFLMDPVNPYHNYLHGVGDTVLQMFSTFAEVTLTRLDQAEHVAKSSSREYDFAKIFEQQPKSYYF